jgi:hypothetical protein
VFDAREHGWDGYVERLFSGIPTDSFKEARCKKYLENVFKVDIVIRSKGKLHFMHNACQKPVEDRRTFSEDEWVNAFSKIAIYLKCDNCNRKRFFLDFETM